MTRLSPVGLRDDEPVGRRSPVLVFLLMLSACGGTPSTSQPSLDAGTLAFAGSEQLNVRIADTTEERDRGLMNVTALPPDDGMAFVWTDPTTGTFWMKDTLIPLSIAFVDAEGTIVSIDDMQPCDADPCPTYASSAPYTMAVEANAGWFAEHGVGTGDRVTWVR
jgi:uncharacterized membrane protein (UPF0127 family)